MLLGLFARFALCFKTITCTLYKKNATKDETIAKYVGLQC